MRNHQEYTYLWIGLFKDDKNWKQNFVRRIMFNRCKKMLLKSIEEFDYDAAED